MSIETREPSTAFDFGQAAGAWFNTSGGKEYALRLWFWHSGIIFLLLLVTVPFFMPSMADTSEASWLMNRATAVGETPDMNALLASFGSAVPSYLVLFLGIWVATSLGEAAFYRKYLTGEEPARIPMRFNSFVIRNMLCQLGFYIIWMLVIILLTFLVGIVTGLFSVVSPIIGGIIFLIGLLAVFAFTFVVFPVRVAPAAALTALNEKVHVLSAKDITKNRFWALFGAYIVTYIGGYIGYYVIYIIVLIAISGNPDIITAMSGLSTENPRLAIEAMLERTSSPLIMIITVLGIAAIAAAWSAWMFWIAGVSAYAVRLWQSDDPTIAFE